MPNQAGTAAAESARELYEQGQRVKEDIVKLGGAAKETVSGWESTLREEMERHPYRVLGAAAAVGYILGGGVPSLLVRAAWIAGARLMLEKSLMSYAARRLGETSGEPTGETA